MSYRTRFAPSPTGPLHLGHAYSALCAYARAKAAGGTFLLRIEDIDQNRSRPHWETLIFEDLRWLGIDWPLPVFRQSDRLPYYAAALDQLWRDGLLYRCDCNRRDIANAAGAPQEGVPTHGPDGLIYPGTCRYLHRRNGPRPTDAALRLDMKAALDRLTMPLVYVENGMDAGCHDIRANPPVETIGDIVIARRDMATSYHLSVVVDDAAQSITEVVRGADLADATRIHVILQHLLGLPTPAYHHHRLIRDAAGKRLAKRDDARALSHYRDEGHTPADLRAMLGLTETDAITPSATSSPPLSPR